MTTFIEVAEERRRLADLLERLTDEQWAYQSSCDAWSVQEVVGHLLAGPIEGMRGLLRQTVKARGSMAGGSVVLANRLAAMGPHELVVQLREHAESEFAPPGLGAAAPLTDVVMHGQDICRPLGLTIDIAADRSLVALETAVSPRFVSVNNYRRLSGIRFEATDNDWTWGEGATVKGPSLALAHALWGRRAAYLALEGGPEALQIMDKRSLQAIK